MKTTSIFILGMLAIFLNSCSKDGEQGPAGPTGNANVTVINYESRTFTGLTLYTLPQMTQEKLDSSLILVYYNPSTEVTGSWYPAPGLGPLAAYETRFLAYQTSANPIAFSVALRTTTVGTSQSFNLALTFRKTRIFIVPANNFIAGRGAVIPDLSDYTAVCEFYGIEK